MSLVFNNDDIKFQVPCENSSLCATYDDSQDPSAVYFGCDGTYQTLLKKIQCSSNGKPCSEMKSWQQNFKAEMEEFNGCVGSQSSWVAPATCRSEGFTFQGILKLSIRMNK